MIQSGIWGALAQPRQQPATGLRDASNHHLTMSMSPTEKEICGNFPFVLWLQFVLDDATMALILSRDVSATGGSLENTAIVMVDRLQFF